jgi:hypothetical protein
MDFENFYSGTTRKIFSSDGDICNGHHLLGLFNLFWAANLTIAKLNKMMEMHVSEL